MVVIHDFCADVQAILQKTHVRRMLKTLHEQESAGWEKWLQFEFVRYYHDQDHEPYWECGYEKSLVHRPQHLTNRLDLVYRKKHADTGFYRGVELKVLRQPHSSIKGILQDLINVSQIKESQWELRAVLGLSVYSTDIMKNAADTSKYKGFVTGLISGKRGKIINCNGWSCLAFGWQAKKLSTPKEMKREYHDYLTSLRKLTDKWQISLN